MKVPVCKIRKSEIFGTLAIVQKQIPFFARNLVPEDILLLGKKKMELL